MDSLEKIAMALIIAAGDAKSSYIEAIQEAKEGKFNSAKELIKQGKKAALAGHKAHAQLLQQSTENGFAISLLLLHAEDQMMSCETICIMAEEFIKVYIDNQGLNNKISELEKRGI